MFIMLPMDSKYSTKTAQSLYMRGYFKGRSRFAIAADKLLFCLLFAFAAYIFARAFRVPPAASKLIAILAGMGFLFANGVFVSIRLSAYTEKKRKALTLELARRRLLLQSDAAVSEMLGRLNRRDPEREYALIRKAAPPNEDDICAAVRKHSCSDAAASRRLVLILLYEPTSKLREFAGKLSPELEFALFFDFNELVDSCVSTEDAVLDELASELKRKPPKSGRSSTEMLLRGAGKYRLLGLVLFALSFFMRFSLYFRTLGMLCFLAGLPMDAIRRMRSGQAIV